MIYILGTGYVAQTYSKYFLINSIPHKLISRKDVLYTNPVTLSAFVATAKPSLLINASGYTGKPNVDACEDHKLACLYSNGTMPGFIGEICQALNVPWIHVSSGCIYDGVKNLRDPRPIELQSNPLVRIDISGTPKTGPWTELDEPNFTFRQNSSFYSGSKAMGEELIKKFNNVWICRLRIPFNEFAGPRNYLTKLAQYEKLINASNSITQLDEFVRATVALYNHGASFGIYNVTNPGIVTASSVVERIIKAGIRKSDPIWLNMADFNKMVKAPRSNCLLNSDKINSISPLTEANEAIDQAIAQWTTS